MIGGNGAGPAKIETRAAGGAILLDDCGLLLAGVLGLALVIGILAFAAGTLAIEVVLERGFLVGIIGVGDLIFQILFVRAFFDGLGSNGGAGIVTGGAEAATIELKFDHVFLHNDGGNAGDAALLDRDAELLDARTVFFPIHGSGLVEAKVDALLRSGHINFECDFFAGEVGLERGGVVLRARGSADGNADDGEDDGRAEHSEWPPDGNEKTQEHRQECLCHMISAWAVP